MTLVNALSDQRGYTLVEMVSSLAILAVLGGLVIANTRFGDRHQQVRDAAGRYVTAVRNAESAATSNRVINGSARLAYGVCLTTSAAVNTPGGKCTPPGSQRPDAFQVYARQRTDTAYGQAPTSPDIISSFKLPAGTTFNPSNTCYLDYLPPTPKMQVNGSGSATCTLVMDYQGYMKTIVIRPAAGAVYVQ